MPVVIIQLSEHTCKSMVQSYPQGNGHNGEEHNIIRPVEPLWIRHGDFSTGLSTVINCGEKINDEIFFYFLEYQDTQFLQIGRQCAALFCLMEQSKFLLFPINKNCVAC